MAILARIEAARVSAYRAYVIAKDGHFSSFRAFACDTDADATTWARQLLDDHDIELWSGDRFVTRLNSTGKRGAVSYEVIDGRMVPKAAK
jgi:hypothetical protein